MTAPEYERAIRRAETTGRLDHIADVIEFEHPEVAEFLREKKINRGRLPSDLTPKCHGNLARFLQDVWQAIETGIPRAEAIENARLKFETLPDGSKLTPNVAENIVNGKRREITELARVLDDEN